MKCQYCGEQDSKVVDSRPSEDGESIRRRRECLRCSKRFTTFEKIEDIPITVIKKNNSREPFDANKILAGMVRATTKREVTREQLEKAVSDIENEVRNQLKHEILSGDIGEMVLKKLKKLDTVAYVRFASVYKEFKEVDEFVGEIENVQQGYAASGRGRKKREEMAR